METELPGGLGNAGRVVLVDGTVRRPKSPHRASLLALLSHLNAAGFSAPVFAGEDERGRDMFEFIAGDVPVPPFPAWSLAQPAIESVGVLLRSYHEAVASFRGPFPAGWSAELTDPRGDTLICHNDVCPENVVFERQRATALIDFDFAAPGRPLWDVASCARLWILMRDDPSDDEFRSRLVMFRAFVDAYGVAKSDRDELVDAVIDSRRAGGSFVRRRAEAGEPAFAAMWAKRGSVEGDRRILEWLIKKRPLMLASLQKPRL